MTHPSCSFSLLRAPEAKSSRRLRASVTLGARLSHPPPLTGFLACPVRLPQLLAQSALTSAEVTQVQKLLGDFLRFMQKNHATFFVQEYEAEEPVGLCVNRLS